ncbi:hypothetical protein IHE45_15G003700 [Dioscorea alata]|uniref:Uncharacterized protein n=1 Tax=Dioscorea alata TaxID=55571 RepID=A0ACB7UJB7_DIOAL|nr:hypothetical protein IHE45_15G003700 [Dioscorea alata]
MSILTLHENFFSFLTQSQIQQTKIPQNPTQTKPLLLLRFSPRSILTHPRRRLLSSSGHRPHPPPMKMKTIPTPPSSLSIPPLRCRPNLLHPPTRRSRLRSPHRPERSPAKKKFFAWVSDQPQAIPMLTTSKWQVCCWTVSKVSKGSLEMQRRRRRRRR